MPEFKLSTERSLFKRTRDAWVFLVGDAATFPLESRIFHSITLWLAALIVVDAPYDFFAGLYFSSASCLVIVSVLSFQYYNSRFRGRSHSNTVFALMGMIMLGANYFTNSGINGSTDVVWPGFFLLLLAVSPYRQHLMWTVTYLVVFFIIHLVEYTHPGLVRHPFDLGKGEFIDRVTAFPLPVISIAIIIGFIRRSYDKERAATEEKASTIENRNAQILYQKEQIEKSDAEKNKLLSIIAHDLRAPFNSIQGYLHLLGELDGEERAMVEKNLRKSTQQTVEMLSNLLYWSKSQMDGTAVNIIETNLLSTLKNTLEVEKTLAINKEITLNYQIDDDITVAADTDMLQLVVRNLVNNAIKFTPKEGTINVAAQLLDNVCKISISDNGKGIADDQKKTIFSMASRSTFGTNNEKGVGLGLPLCKEFMELQGGSIGFESKPGEGSTFFILIPLPLRG